MLGEPNILGAIFMGIGIGTVFSIVMNVGLDLYMKYRRWVKK